ncbi:MAG TPA: hypothetical protein VFX50_12995 [Gemmatimonadales bacterium]|nr:hypothetical protein [Gemmatimonadales bacterium]
MPRPIRALALLLACTLPLAACRLEDRTPKGSRRDQVEIQRLLLAYHRRPPAADPAGDPSAGQMRVVRMDVRQEGDLATAWVTTRVEGMPASSRDVLEHFVLRRGAGAWRIVNVAVASGRGSAPRGTE